MYRIVPYRVKTGLEKLIQNEAVCSRRSRIGYRARLLIYRGLSPELKKEKREKERERYISNMVLGISLSGEFYLYDIMSYLET